ARLSDLHGKLAPQLGDIAQQFVDRVAARRDTAGLTSAKQTRRLRSTLVEWLASGLAGPHDEYVCARRSTLGTCPAAGGLSHRHAITAITVVRCEVRDRIDQLYEPPEGRLVARSVDKLLDVELASMVYDPLDADAELVARERSAQSERIAAIQTLSMGLA